MVGVVVGVLTVGVDRRRRRFGGRSAVEQLLLDGLEQGGRVRSGRRCRVATAAAAAAATAGG